MGGCDIITEMHASGELAELLSKPDNASKTAGEPPLEDKLHSLTHSADVVLFMKARKPNSIVPSSP